MADNILKGTIKIEAPGVQQTANAVAQSVEKMEKAFDSIPAVVQQSEQAVKKAFTQMPQATQKAEKAFDNLGNSAGRAASGLKKVDAPAKGATQSLTDLGRIIQDAPFGFIGIANNINPALESFKRLQAETGSTKAALSSMASGLMGAGGLGIAVSIATSLLVVFGDKIFSSGKKAKEAEEDMKGLAGILAGTKGEFEQAFVAVNTLRENVELAKKGFLDKTEVVKEYNKTLGETIGKVNSLDAVEKALAKSGDAYIKFTLLKAAAQQALKKAADAALTAEEQGTKLFKNTPVNTIDEKKIRASLFAEDRNKDHNKGIQAEIGKAKSDSDNFLRIAEDFQKKAAELANQFKFDFFGKEFDDKGGKGKKQEFNFFDKFFDLKPETATDKAKQAMDMFDTAWDFLSKNRDTFVGLDELIQQPSREKMLEKAKAWWSLFEQGLVKIKPQAIDIEAEVKLTPTEVTIDTSGVEQFKRGLEKALQKGNSEGGPFTKEDLDSGKNQADKFAKDQEKKRQQLIKTANTVSNSVTPAFQALFKAIIAGENPLKAFFNAIEQALISLIEQLIAAAVTAAVLSLITGGGSGGVSFGSAFKSILGGGNGFPSASGGRSAGRVQSSMGSLGGGLGGRVEVFGRVSGRDIVLSSARDNRLNGRAA
jgi:hypothetical protein